MLGLAAAAFILLVAVGLLMVMYDEIEERVDWHRSKKFYRERSRQEGIEQRAERIARIERELGINTRHKQPP